VSSSSPAPGSATRGRRAGARGTGGKAAEAEAGATDDKPTSGGLRIGLEHMRYRHLSWMAFGVITGSLLLWKLGSVGQWLGIVLLAIGVFATYSFVRTLVFPAGTISVGDDGVELPRGLCRGEPVRFELAQIEHAYLLRRAVPWTRAAPVLVIEAGGRPFSYPRDWFVTEADQRRVVRELHARGAGRSSLEVALPAEPEAGAKS
jgi:hypothetical protein